jgi:selenophosphate synthase
MFDPQTSGGLLFSVGHSTAEEALEKLQTTGIQAVFVGSVIEKTGKTLQVG